jgi:hypothetical protein
MAMPQPRTILALAEDALAAAHEAPTHAERDAWTSIAEGWLQVIELMWPGLTIAEHKASPTVH